MTNGYCVSIQKNLLCNSPEQKYNFSHNESEGYKNKNNNHKSIKKFLKKLRTIFIEAK